MIPLDYLTLQYIKSMLPCFMVSGLSALGFAPNAPTTGQPVCKPVTPEHSNGNSYPLSFQYISRPSFSSSLNGNPPILFLFTPLQATSSPTGGYTPLLPFSLAQGRDHSLDFPRTRPHRLLDFPPLWVSFGNKGGFFTAFPAAPQDLKFFRTVRSLR
jgi:hypothetical protein